MRCPTTLDEAYAWHRAALAGDNPPIHGDDPKCGWFRRKMVKDGGWVPARIWLYQDIDQSTGLLADDERLLCEVDGKSVDVFDQWTWLAGNPISERDYRDLDAARSEPPAVSIPSSESSLTRDDLRLRPVLPPQPEQGALFDA